MTREEIDLLELRTIVYIGGRSKHHGERATLVRHNPLTLELDNGKQLKPKGPKFIQQTPVIPSKFKGLTDEEINCITFALKLMNCEDKIHNDWIVTSKTLLKNLGGYNVQNRRHTFNDNARKLG